MTKMIMKLIMLNVSRFKIIKPFSCQKKNNMTFTFIFFYSLLFPVCKPSRDLKRDGAPGAFISRAAFVLSVRRAHTLDSDALILRVARVLQPFAAFLTALFFSPSLAPRHPRPRALTFQPDSESYTQGYTLSGQGLRAYKVNGP